VIAAPSSRIGQASAKLVHSANGFRVVADAEGKADCGVPDDDVPRFVDDVEWPIGIHLYGPWMWCVLLGDRADWHRPSRHHDPPQSLSYRNRSVTEMAARCWCRAAGCADPVPRGVGDQRLWRSARGSLACQNAQFGAVGCGEDARADPVSVATPWADRVVHAAAVFRPRQPGADRCRQATSRGGRAVPCAEGRHRGRRHLTAATRL
jgi:hypothetical protein